MPLIRKKNLKRLAKLLLDLQVCLQVPNAGCPSASGLSQFLSLLPPHPWDL